MALYRRTPQKHPMKTPHFLTRAGIGLTLAGLLLASITLASKRSDKPSLTLTPDSTPIERTGAASYAPMLESARQTVVSVHTAEVVRVVRSSGSTHDELLRRFFGIPSPRRNPRAEPEVEERHIPQGVGSGVIVSADGYILTNNHVVSDQRGGNADEILVRLDDGRELSAEIVGRDPKTDVAVLKVDAEGLPAAKIADSDQIKVGDIVFAIGNPMGVGLTVTSGIVSATGRSIGIYGREGYEDFIQTDASINPGNSGGALVDIEGRLVGINSAILSRSGGNIGIGFAIPSNLAVHITRQLTDSGEVRRGFVGVSISALTPDMAEAFGLKNTKGVLVDEVVDGLPADRAGLKRGDIITTLDGKPVTTPNELRLAVSHITPGATLKVGAFRDGKPLSIEMKVGDQSNQLGSTGDEILGGVTVTPLTDDLRREYGIPGQLGGLVISKLDPSSPYARLLASGMVLLEVNDQPAATLDQARRTLRKGVNKLYLYDRGRTGYLALRVE